MMFENNEFYTHTHSKKNNVIIVGIHLFGNQNRLFDDWG